MILFILILKNHILLILWKTFNNTNNTNNNKKNNKYKNVGNENKSKNFNFKLNIKKSPLIFIFNINFLAKI